MKKWMSLSIALTLICAGAYIVTENTITFTTGFKMVEASAREHIFSVKNDVADVATIGTDDESTVNEVYYPVRPSIGEIIGELYIPKLNTILPIIHGTEEDELEKGIGHFAGSVLPGENDNSVLAGHRDTVFRKLGEVGLHDELIVKTSAGTFTYIVRDVRIVDKDDRTVIVSMPEATLTLSTCYPFTFIGPAPKRNVLVADLVTSE